MKFQTAGNKGNESALNWKRVGFGVEELHTLIVVSYPIQARSVIQTQAFIFCIIINVHRILFSSVSQYDSLDFEKADDSRNIVNFL
ncbi:hypothetical protein BTU61_06255 [Streptococcus lactarius]|uniref:Uncharacterized protein n=1 Tax=Streptococcus lactarius TaxID=684066 RepID=A0A9X0WN38_9STRE|nr:hypothetical protein [Streptococcus lactarius]